MHSCEVISSLNDVEERLGGLGLSSSVLAEVVAAAYRERMLTGPLHPKTFPGQVMHACLVSGLRCRLLHQSWEMSSNANFELVFSEQLGVAVAVASGSKGTGIVEGRPRTRNPKGKCTEDAIEANRQLSFFDDPKVSEIIEMPRGEMATWYLLSYVEAGKEVRAELSLPRGMLPGGHVDSWSTRLILPALSLDDETIDIDMPDFPDIDIDVRRKKSD